MRTIAIVPARAGSRRMPCKNRLEIEPYTSLAQHAVDCARGSRVIDQVVVLTDDPDLPIRGAQILHEPAELASDTADIAAAVAHATDVIERSIGPVDYVVTLQPAVVARSPLIVQRIVHAVIERGAGGGVTAARTVPWVWRLRHGHAGNTWTPNAYPRSDESGITLVEINAVQVARRSAVARGERWATPLLLAELPHWAAALDIDEPEDLSRVRDLWPWARPRLETWEPEMHLADRINGWQSQP